MGAPTQQTTVVADGVAKLTGNFQQQPNIVAFLKACLAQKQALENAIFPILAAIQLRTATLYTLPSTNAFLDILGQYIGQPRGGLSDHDYQAVLFIKAAVNRSAARHQDWSRIAAVLLSTSGGPVSFTEGVAAFYLFVGNMTLNPNVVASVLAGGVGDGIGAQLGYSTWADGNDFEWDDVNNPSTTGQGTFGDSVAGLVGGLLVSAAGVA